MSDNWKEKILADVEFRWGSNQISSYMNFLAIVADITATEMIVDQSSQYHAPEVLYNYYCTAFKNSNDSPSIGKLFTTDMCIILYTHTLVQM